MLLLRNVLKANMTAYPISIFIQNFVKFIWTSTEIEMLNMLVRSLVLNRTLFSTRILYFINILPSLFPVTPGAQLPPNLIEKNIFFLDCHVQRYGTAQDHIYTSYEYPFVKRN